MSESTSHKRTKRKAAGPGGKTEVLLPNGKRLDALSKNKHRATEVERSKKEHSLLSAARRLKTSKAKQKVLQVPQTHMASAAKAMRKIGVGGTVKNMGGTKRFRVRKQK